MNFKRERYGRMGSMQTDLLDILLAKRGILDTQTREFFLNPDYDRDIHDPYLLKGMDKAVKRVISAIEKNERICVYSDYDCDGIPGAVVLSDFFHAISYENVEFYIPDRHSDGYGLRIEALENLNLHGVQLVITVDLGITAVDAVDFAKNLGIDVIITDHHLPHEVLPDAVSIINPKQVDDTYPFKELCGAGVAFKLVQALVQEESVQSKTKQGFEKWLLDMVSIATLSDMVPLIGENRALVYFGMKVLRKARRPGLQALFRETKLDPRTLTEDDITFSITPRINAASRMDDPYVAFELLRTHDDKEALLKAVHLTKINNERKTTVASIIKEAHTMLRKREDKPVIVLGNPAWRPGILGLVASKISEEYSRPTFVWGSSEEGQILKGSCRSDGSINVVSLMAEATDVLHSFGGHELAGGFEIQRENMFDLEEVLIKGFNKLHVLKNEDVIHEYDHELLLEHVNQNVHDILTKLSPFGLGNPRPVFLFRSIIVSGIKLFGKHKEHIEVTLTDENIQVSGIRFFANESGFSKKPEIGERVGVIGNIEASTFLGRTNLRVRILDLI